MVGWLKARSLSVTMNRPLLRAASLIFSIALKIEAKSPVELITICTGRPPIEAGSGGSEKTKACMPSTALTFCCTAGLICWALRERSPQGFRMTPAMPWFGPNRPLTTKRRSALGERGERLVELVAIGVEVIEIGVLRRLGQREQHALVLFRRQLACWC